MRRLAERLKSPYFYPRSPCGERRGCRPLPPFRYAYFYPRSPCGERPAQRVPCLRRTKISIHVPLAGNVGAWSSGNLDAPVFLSTFPLRGTSRMSTHPLPATGNFYPRSPCGERQQPGVRDARVDVISIHVPLAGNVPACNQASSVRRNFYPRSPCGERPLVVNRVERIFLNFYPRSPCGERRAWQNISKNTLRFLSTFPLRGTSRHS